MITPITLPKPHRLKKLMQSLAALDAILSPEWEYRYYSFDAHWGVNEQMGSIRNGSGDDVFVLFNSAGCFLKGFSHEYPNSEYAPESFYRSVPPDFQSAVSEPAFSPSNVTFCSWWLRGQLGGKSHLSDEQWQSSVAIDKVNSDSFFLLQGLSGNPQSYQKFAEEYHEIDADIKAIQSIFDHQHISKESALGINPDIDYGELSKDLSEIGYPV